MKVRMSKSEWLKIGESQGWMDKESYSDGYQKHAWVNFAVKAGLLAAPYVIKWLFGGDEEAAKQAVEEAKDNPEEIQKMMQFVQNSNQQAQYNTSMLSQAIPYLKDIARKINAPCANTPDSSTCQLDIKSLEDFASRAREVQTLLSSTERMSDPGFVCDLLQKATSLYACSQTVNQQSEPYIQGYTSQISSPSKWA